MRMDNQTRVPYSILFCAMIEGTNKSEMSAEAFEELCYSLRSFVREALKILGRLDNLEPEVRDEKIEGINDFYFV